MLAESSTRWRDAWLLALGLSLAAGCAGRADARVRRAFRDAGQAAQPEGPRAGRERPADGRADARSRRLTRVEGWERMGLMIDRVIVVLARSPDPESFELIAARWCEVEPEPLQTEFGEVRVCSPETPLDVDGSELVLELGSFGTVGFVARELSGKESQAFVRRASEKMQDRCLGPYQTMLGQEGPSARRSEFFTCPVFGGSTLALGRVPNPGTSSWQASIAVLGVH